MRTAKAALAVASVLAVVGLLLVFVINAVPTFTIGSFNEGGGMPFLLFFTTQRAIGFALLWIASMLVAGVIGHRLAGAGPNP